MGPTISRPHSGRRRNAPRYAAVLLLVLLFLSAHCAAAASDRPVGHYETRYATVVFTDKQDLYAFSRMINQGMTLFSDNPEKDPFITRNRVDRIVDTVMTLLDMHPPKLHFSIYLLRGRSDVETAYHRLGIMGKAPPAFYNHQSESITLSVGDIAPGMLAHEIAHAVICFHFGTPPPMKMQEILAQFVDKHLED